VKDECQLITIPCPNKGCSASVVKKDLDKHLQQCGYRILNCQWCKQDICYDQKQVRTYNTSLKFTLIFAMQEHENECPCIPVECPNKCLESVPRKLVSIHVVKMLD